MTEQAPSLLTFYQGWKTYQDSLIETVAPLSSEQLALPAASDQWTIGRLIQHIIVNRVWWFQGWMGEGSPDLAPLASWRDPSNVKFQPVSDVAPLVAGLASSWKMIEASLSHWTHADFGQIFQPPSSLREDERGKFRPFSRQWIIWHVLEHEIHHGGELSLILGPLGLEGIYGTA